MKKEKKSFVQVIKFIIPPWVNRRIAYNKELYNWKKGNKGLKRKGSIMNLRTGFRERSSWKLMVIKHAGTYWQKYGDEAFSICSEIWSFSKHMFQNAWRYLTGWFNRMIWKTTIISHNNSYILIAIFHLEFKKFNIRNIISYESCWNMSFFFLEWL